MNNEINDEKKVESYKCQICGKDSKNSVDAITHYLDHGSNALNAVNALIKDQRTGSLTTEDKARISAEEKTSAIKEKEVMVAKES